MILLIDNYDISYNYEQIEKTRIIEDSLNCMQKEDKDMFVLYYYFSKSINTGRIDLYFFTDQC